MPGMDNQLFVLRYPLELPSKEALDKFIEHHLKNSAPMLDDVAAIEAKMATVVAMNATYTADPYCPVGCSD